MTNHPPPGPDWVLGDDGHWKPPPFSASGPGAAPPGAGTTPTPGAPPEPPTPPRPARAPVGWTIAVVVLVVAVAAVGIGVITGGGSGEPTVAADEGAGSTTEPASSTTTSSTAATSTTMSTTTAPPTTTASATTAAATVPPTTAPALPAEAPAWCPSVPGVDGPGLVGHDLVPTGIEAYLGTADMCLYDGGTVVAARWEGRTVGDLEDSTMSNFQFTANDGEAHYVYYDGDVDRGCATHETADTVYGACGWVGGDQRMYDLHQAIKDVIG